MHPQLLNGKQLCYEEKQYLADVKYAKQRKLHDRDLTKYQCDILRDRRPEHTVNDEIKRNSTNSIYAKLNQVEYLSRSQYLPFTESMFLGDKTHDPRGYTNEPLMEKRKQYSYDRAKITDMSLYPRSAPRAIVDGQRTQQQLQSDMQQTILDRKDRLKIFSQQVTNNVYVRPRPQQDFDDITRQKHEQQQSQDLTEKANEQLAPQIISMPRSPIKVQNLQVSDHKLLVSDYGSMIKAVKYGEDPALMTKIIDSFVNRHDTNTDKLNDQLGDALQKISNMKQNIGSITDAQYDAVKLEILDKLLSCVTYHRNNINQTDQQIRHSGDQQQLLPEQIKSIVRQSATGTDTDQLKVIKLYTKIDQELQNSQKTELYKQMAQAELDPSKVTKMYQQFGQQFAKESQSCIYKQKIQNIQDLCTFLQVTTQHPQCKLSDEQKQLVKHAVEYLQLRDNQSCVVDNTEDINRVMQDLTSVIIQQQQKNTDIGKQWQQQIQEDIEDSTRLSDSIKSAMLLAINNKKTIVENPSNCVNIANHLLNQQKDHMQKTLECKNSNIQWLQNNASISAIQMVVADQLMRNSKYTQQKSAQIPQVNYNSVFYQMDDQERQELQQKLMYIIIERQLNKDPNHFNSTDQRTISEQIQSQIAKQKDTQGSNISQLLKAVLGDNKASAVFEQMPKIRQQFNQKQIMALLECIVSEEANQQIDQSIGSISSGKQQDNTYCADYAGATIYCNYRNLMPSNISQTQEGQFGNSMSVPSIKANNPNLYQIPRNDISTQDVIIEYKDETFNTANARVGNLRPSRQFALEDAGREL